jgi:alpha-L-fucosidase
VDALKAIGAWMKVNGEAIYGTTASPFGLLPWGRCTKKAKGGNTVLYLSVFDWPGDGKLKVPGLKSAVVGAKLLAGGGALETSATEEGLTIQVPQKAPDPIASVIRIEVSGIL